MSVEPLHHQNVFAEAAAADVLRDGSPEAWSRLLGIPQDKLWILDEILLRVFVDGLNTGERIFGMIGETSVADGGSEYLRGYSDACEDLG
jgi:hypothetical protein